MVDGRKIAEDVGPQDMAMAVATALIGLHRPVGPLADPVGVAVINQAGAARRRLRKLAIRSNRPSCRLGMGAVQFAPSADQTADGVEVARGAFISPLIQVLQIERQPHQMPQLFHAQVGRA